MALVTAPSVRPSSNAIAQLFAAIQQAQLPKPEAKRGRKPNAFVARLVQVMQANRSDPSANPSFLSMTLDEFIEFFPMEDGESTQAYFKRANAQIRSWCNRAADEVIPRTVDAKGNKSDSLVEFQVTPFPMFFDNNGDRIDQHDDETYADLAKRCQSTQGASLQHGYVARFDDNDWVIVAFTVPPISR